MITVFEEREVLGKDFRIYGDIENPLFLAKDVAEWIEHSDVTMMLNKVDESEKLVKTVFVSGQNRNMWFLTEDGLYEVMMQSRKPIAKKFKKEVKAILKSIRKRGAYMTPKFIEETLTKLKEEQEKNNLSIHSEQTFTFTQIANGNIDRKLLVFDINSLTGTVNKLIDINKKQRLKARLKELAKARVDMTEIKTYVYFIENTKNKCIKIGTSQNPNESLSSMQVANVDKLKIIKIINGSYKKEKQLHKLFKKYKVRKNGEWFKGNIKPFILDIP